MVYVFRKGTKDSIALRYSLRSLSNVPHDNVYIVGDAPGWIRNITHIPVKDVYDTKSYKGRILNTWGKLKVACEAKSISEDFILFYDDCFVLRTITDFFYYHKGTVPKYKNPNGHQMTVLKATKGFKNPLHFGIHTPMVFNKKKLLNLCKIYDLNKGVHIKILYGNHYDVSPKVQIKDAKIRTIKGLSNLEGRTFLSTHNQLEGSHEFERVMSGLFPNKSNYEVDIL